MKCHVFGFLLLGTAAAYSYVPPAGNQLGFLEVLKDIFLGRVLKDFPRCGRPIQESDSSKRGLEKGKRQRKPEIPECLNEDGKTVVMSHQEFGPSGPDYANNQNKVTTR